MEYAVILAGGKGIRFWPFSRQDEPKQLLKIFGKYSLLQHTFLRISKMIPAANIYIVTNGDYGYSIRYQLAEFGFPVENIIVEPAPKNTAASIGLAASLVEKRDPQGTLAVFPADHFIKDEQKFLGALKKAFNVAQRGKFVIFGIKPLRPERAYGYVQTLQTKSRDAKKVSRFIEKPDEHTAEELIQKGSVYWNGGIFVAKASVLLDQIRCFLPDLSRVLEESRKKIFIRRWKNLRSISIDYGVLEKCKKDLYLVPLDCGWTDLGNWSTIDLVLKRDQKGNALQGDVLALDTSNSTIWGTHHLVVAVGLKDMIIADTADALLVAPKDQAQRVSDVVEILKAKKRFEYLTSRSVSRHWGKYSVLHESGKFKTKIVEVDPHGRLSLQLHQRRAEHWIVVEGRAKVTIGKKTHFVKSNNSIFVPKGKVHRIENPGNTKLVIIEVQTGDYLGEDDIRRLQDDYER